MGKPKSAGGPDAAGDGDTAGDGRGGFDPVTGLWDYYEQPEDTGSSVTWEEILAHWGLLVADFAEHYGIRLHTRPAMTWAEFQVLVEGLLAMQSRLWRATRPPEQEAVPKF